MYLAMQHIGTVVKRDGRYGIVIDAGTPSGSPLDTEVTIAWEPLEKGERTTEPWLRRMVEVAFEVVETER